ncbi:MAG: AMP-binding protein [Rhodocyclaceae bacterium]|nr:AMP-binding protein [Rhodocyclaceae bacterium]
MNPESAASRLLALVRTLAQELRKEAPEVRNLGLSAHLERDFGLDSLARVELFSRIEQEFGVTLPSAAFSAETPADLLPLLKQAAAASPPLSPESESEKKPRLTAASPYLPPPPELATLPEILDWHDTHQPERTHLVLLAENGDSETLSFGQLAHEARCFAAGLLARGIEKGNRIALMLPTSLEFFVAFHGALYAGCVPVPLYPPTRPAQLSEHLRRIASILNNAQATWFVCDAHSRTFAEALLTNCPTLAGVDTVPAVRAAHPLPAPMACKGEDLAFLQYTSGSTGDPKGVMLSHANLLANIRAMQRAAQVSETDVFVSWLPLYHDMGLIGAGLGSFVAGFLLVLMSPLSFLSRPVRWLRAISAHRATLSGAPNFAYEICATKIADAELAGLDLSRWRFAFNGAEPVSASTLDRFATRFAPYGFRRTALAPVYGLAECSVGLTFPPLGRAPRIDRIDRRLLSDAGLATPSTAPPPTSCEIVGCGHPLPGHEVRIVDAQGHPLPERHVGHIQFRGPSASPGYFANPAATARLVDGAWRNSGDLGYLADGELFVTGRDKDIIIRGGHNLHPQELETAIGRLAGIRAGNVAVFPATDPATGSEKLVVLAETREQDPRMRAQLRDEIDRLAIMLMGLPADDILLAPPGTVLKTSSGKIRRAACRAAYESGALHKTSTSWRWPMVELMIRAWLGRMRRILRDAARVSWGAWAWLVYLLLAPLFWFLIVMAPTRLSARQIARIGARLLLAASGLPVEQTGGKELRALIAQGRPVVVVANHMSYLDGLLLTAILPPRFAFVAKQELSRHPLSSPPLKRLAALFVERYDASRSREDTLAAEARLAAGESIVIFPEGTFFEAPGLLPFRLGAFLIAARSNVPLVPVTIHGTRQILPGERRWPRWHPLRVHIDAPLLPIGKDWPAILQLRDKARAAILARLGEPDAAR